MHKRNTVEGGVSTITAANYVIKGMQMKSAKFKTHVERYTIFWKYNNIIVYEIVQLNEIVLSSTKITGNDLQELYYNSSVSREAFIIAWNCMSSEEIGKESSFYAKLNGKDYIQYYRNIKNLTK